MSPQSSSPSHFQPWGLQRVLLHWNSSFGQCLTTGARGAGQKETAKVLHASTGGIFCPASLFLTAAVAFLLVAAVQAVGVGVAVPSQRDAVAVFALELVAVALHLAAVLCGTTKDCVRERQQGATVRRSGKKRRRATSSDPSAQSWSPSHFQRPAMQRPLVQANSLSEHLRGTGEHTGRVKETVAAGERAWGVGGGVGKKQGEV